MRELDSAHPPQCGSILMVYQAEVCTIINMYVRTCSLVRNVRPLVCMHKARQEIVLMNSRVCMCMQYTLGVSYSCLKISQVDLSFCAIQDVKFFYHF